MKNLNEYAKENNLEFKPVVKTGSVRIDKRAFGRAIRRGYLVSVASDGTVETKNRVSKTTSVVVSQLFNRHNKWVIEKETFVRKYNPPRRKVCKPKSAPMEAAGPINENITFLAPWGEEMTIAPGGFILRDMTNNSDIYAISGIDFQKTYTYL